MWPVTHGRCHVIHRGWWTLSQYQVPCFYGFRETVFWRYSQRISQCLNQWMSDIGTADQNWFSVVVLNLGLPVYREFPCLKIFPLHNLQKRDCPRILAHPYLCFWIVVANALTSKGRTMTILSYSMHKVYKMQRRLCLRLLPWDNFCSPWLNFWCWWFWNIYH